MGFSTPKAPFNLADFLSQKGTPRRAHRPRFARRPAEVAPDPSGDETAATLEAAAQGAPAKPEAE